MSNPFISYDPKTQQWTLENDLVVDCDGYSLVVPAGFVSDLASVPRILWGAVAPMELSEQAALVHDWLYRHGGLIRASSVGYPGTMCTVRFTRAQADTFLRDIALQDGASSWRARSAYYAVRWFARGAWQS